MSTLNEPNSEQALAFARDRARAFVFSSVLCPFEDSGSPVEAITEHIDHIAEFLEHDGDELQNALREAPRGVRDRIEYAAADDRIVYMRAGYLFGLEVGRQLASGGARSVGHRQDGA